MTRTAMTAAAAAAAATAGYLCCTPQGRKMMQEGVTKARTAMDDCMDQYRSWRHHRQVEGAVSRPHPDTAVAAAFEESLAS